MAAITPLFTIVALLIFSSAATAEDASFVRTLDRKLYGLRREKLSHFRLYWHDIVGGKNPTTFEIVRPISNASETLFGMVRIINNPLTAGPEESSKVWGRAQGLYASVSPENFRLLMAMNFAFISGKYNGSTITILGRNAIGAEGREMPVVGGSGLFRFARGYVQPKTIKVDAYSAVVEYNVYVLHY